VVVRTCFVVGVLRCRVRFSGAHRVRTPHYHSLRDASPTPRPRVARAGCVAEARSNTEQLARPLNGLPSLVPLFAFATDIFAKLQADINERVNLRRFEKLGQSLGVLHPASATVPLRVWLRARLLRVAWARSVTSTLNTMTPFSASRFVASSVYHNP
jgi:hypothetical protein